MNKASRTQGLELKELVANSQHGPLRSYRNECWVSQSAIASYPLLLPPANTNCYSYGLFKAKDKKLLERDDLALRLSTAEKINDE